MKGPFFKDEYFTIIPDTGIQFLKVPMSIDLNVRTTSSLFFNQYKPKFGLEENKIALEQAMKLPDGRIVARSLVRFEPDGTISETQQDNLIELVKNRINEDGLNELITISNIKDALDLFQEHWLPAPMFEYHRENQKSIFGPTGWCRMKICDLEYVVDDEKNVANFVLVFVFDTKVEEQTVKTNQSTPFSAIESNQFDSPNILLPKQAAVSGRTLYKLCPEVNKIMDYFSQEKNGEWVEKYLLSIVHDGKLPTNNTPLKYLMSYVYLIKFLADTETVPEVLVFPEELDQSKTIPVDLVLDIGNSRTCGLLFEADIANESYNFNSVQKLNLNDLSQPSNVYSDAFSMRLTFADFNFGDFYVDGAHEQLFCWPSILRIGGEADRLLRQYDISKHRIEEASNSLSSPKRYLWDKNPSEQSWEYVNLKKDFDPTQNSQSVHYSNFTSHVTEDGRFTTEVLQGSKPVYSRGALMVFVFVELFNHTLSQINSYEFRNKAENNQTRKRYLRNLVLTCPTAMSIEEQLLLREYAETALKVLNNFVKITIDQIKASAGPTSGFDSNLDLSAFRIDSLEPSSEGTAQNNEDKLSGPFAHVNIIPSPADIRIPNSERHEKKHWIFDEASTSQILFIYSELAKKYEDNFDEFFKLYAKKRPDTDIYTLTVASVDIGGGTTDLMICNYDYNTNRQSTELTPDPLYWETFNLAGDDLLKDIVHQVLINGLPGEEGNSISKGGIIRSYVAELGIPDGEDKILGIFGRKYFDPLHNIYRKNLITQVFTKISYKFFDFLAKSNADVETYSYQDIFGDAPPNRDLIQFLNNYFGHGFNFEDIKWTARRDDLNKVIYIKFKEVFKQISTLAFTHKADFVLLSGKPTTLPEIRNIFINELPTTPDRIISMANHKIGDWYPFSTVRGILDDPKTTVSVGAMIYLLAGELRQLDGFSLNTEKLISKLDSTANYIGNYNSQNEKIDKIILDPNKNRETIVISTLPHILASKQLQSDNYNSRCLFRLSLNLTYIIKSLERRHPTWDRKSLKEKALEERNSKFEITLSRDMNVNKEAVEVERIINLNTGEELDEKFIRIEVVSLKDEKGYWLDTGQFILSNQSINLS